TLALALTTACSSVAITPASIQKADAPEESRRSTIVALREGTLLANEFLESPFRDTLPKGRFELDDVKGLRFIDDAGAWPIEIECTTWGDLCTLCGFAAQEREWGFVIGSMKPARDRRIDNSLFVSASGWREPPRAVADLILHETTHVVWREGTVGFWNG